MVGLTVEIWAFQYMSLVPTVPSMETYYTRALFLFPMGLIIILLGVVIFVLLGSRRASKMLRSSQTDMRVAALTWGDAVQVAANAPLAFRPGQPGSICSIRENPLDASAPVSQAAHKSRLYLVEFGDGDSIEVPEEYLDCR
jgi:hypothetical protein